MGIVRVAYLVLEVFLCLTIDLRPPLPPLSQRPQSHGLLAGKMLAERGGGGRLVENLHIEERRLHTVQV